VVFENCTKSYACNQVLICFERWKAPERLEPAIIFRIPVFLIFYLTRLSYRQMIMHNMNETLLKEERSQFVAERLREAAQTGAVGLLRG